ncbi:hypothetical protein FOYG_15113 [Fusarium oxysporum NRRL 32931]|uniref:Uncharacterized protein n=1 Tax=Fusarium oxysporum NRRL 32931 TaxID=660029 RepID=W9HL84_FUSOX|nr:hypothetical protein FOYG_15113 [Fusarium oxysporum NRRL 32931]
MEDELSDSEDYNYADRQQTLLWKAVKAGQEDTARSLLRHDFIRINETDYEGRTLLSLAVGLGHTNIVECLLDRNDIDVNLQDGNGNLPLNEAAGNGHEAISSLLLEKDDIEVNLKDGDKRTPLIKAASNGHGAIVRQLLEKNDIDVNLGNDEGDTPLVEAAWNGHETVVSLLLGKTDIQPNARGESGITPLYTAAAEGHNIVVGLLLERDDIELNVKTSSDETPLFAAANNGHESVTKLLLSRDGIDLNVNCHGDTPLSAALDRGHKAVSELLLYQEGNELEHNGSIDRGYFLLSKALDRGLQDIASKILIAKISRNVEIPIGRSPLSWAAERNKTDQVRTILRIDTVDPNLRDAQGRTPLSRAAECDSISVMSLLLESGRIDVNNGDLDRRTPLSIAADAQNYAVVSILVTRDTVTLHSLVREGNLSSVEILLDNRYDINTKNGVGQSSLHVAVDNNRFDIAVRLLSRGANVNAEDHSSTTPLCLAVQQKRRDFAQLLLDYSASTKGITFHGWRSLYEEFSPQYTLRITEKASGSRRVDFLSRNNVLANEPETSRQLFLLPDYQTWSFAILKSLNTTTMMYTKPPDLQDAMQMECYHCYTGQTAGAYAVAYFPILQLDLSKGKITWEGCGVGWSMGKLGQDSGSVRYFSMLQESGIPDDGYELFQQLLAESTSKWLEFCIQFEDNLSQIRLDQLKSQGKSPETISHLAENALHIAQLRRALQGQVRSAEEFSTDLGRRHGVSKEQRALEYIHRFADIRQQLQILDETIRNLLQFEFAWASINEAHKSTSLAISMKRLSWITFIFLPAMFAASLFGMNVDILENNPDWRWYLLFMGSLLVLTTIGWLFFKYLKVEGWLKAHIGRRI